MHTSPRATTQPIRRRRLRMESLESRQLLVASVVINEFLADNQNSIFDEDGTHADWIELTNVTPASIDLTGWHLTDKAGNLNLWTFPTTTLPAGGSLLVFASGKDRAISGSQLHTNFQLNAAGEYLALVRPDGMTVEFDFGAQYPAQLPDVSYGIATSSTVTTPVSVGAPGTIKVPLTSGDMPSGWNNRVFDDSSWTSGSSAVGFDTGVAEVAYPDLIAAAGPLHYWRFEQTSTAEAAVDQGTTPTNPGIYRGGIALGQPSASAALGSAAHFDGTEPVGGTTVDVGLFHPGGNVSVEAWVNGDTFLTKSFHAIAARWDGSYELDVNGGSGKANFVVRNNTNAFGIVESSQAITPGVWHHLVGIFSGGVATIYLDGVQGTSSNIGGTLQNAGPNRVLIGATRDANFSWTGSIDEVAVYNRALSASEIQNHYSAAASSGGVAFGPHIQTDLTATMHNAASTALVRIPFTLSDPASVDRLNLQLKYDDGFIAYINGQEVARRNAPGVGGQSAAYNAIATAAHTDALAVELENIDISAAIGALHVGDNVLAIQGLNMSASDGDFLLAAKLEAFTLTRLATLPVLRYFVSPSPGAANGAGLADRGPVVNNVAHTPAAPTDNQNIVVTAHVAPLTEGPTNPMLHYRVMYGGEVAVAMHDDGLNSDLLSGDGIYTGVIPASASGVGEMVRYYVTAGDLAGNTSRWPLIQDPLASEEYLGTVIADPTVTSQLDILQWFVQNPAAADSAAGTRASLFYQGEFYDNVFVRQRGATAISYPKKPYKFDFNPGHYFQYQANTPRVEEINLNSTFQDKTYLRAPLAMETYRLAGVPAPDAFNVHVEQNGDFYSLAVMVEQIDATFLEKRDLDPTGALYKLYNGLESAVGAEKKTRRDEPATDLEALAAGLAASNPNRNQFLLDNLDIPAVINYLAAGTISQDFDRTVKNWYLYRDTNGTGLWQIFPWDKDLTFGLRGLTSDYVSGSDDINGGISHPLFGTPAYNCCGVNVLFDAVYSNPVTREMYVRRLRTLMDELLQAPTTPVNQRFYEQRIDALQAQLQADAALDLAKWGNAFGTPQSAATATSALKSSYLAERRNHLYITHSVDNLPNYPAAAGIPHAQVDLAALAPPDRHITFGAVDHSPVSANQDEEYLTLVNSNSFAVDISGWTLSEGVTFTFAPGTVIPAAKTLYVSPNVATFRARAISPTGGQSLLVVGGFQGHLSAFGETIRLSDAAGAEIAEFSYLGDPSGPQQYLRISEIMYNPAAPPLGDLTDNDEFEFVEFINTGADTLNLAGVHFAQGVQFTFGATTLAAGQRVLVVKNQAAFESRYGTGLNIAGQFTLGTLDNGGEVLKVEDAANGTIVDFAYNDSWYPTTDGAGNSLVLRDLQTETNLLGQKPSWRPSHLSGGSPGLADPAPAAVSGRHVFYNNSRFDGNDPAAAATDDQAITGDKLPLVAGQTATSVNYTSYSRGINGVMVDIDHLVGPLGTTDFEFRIGNDNTPAGWQLAASPAQIVTRSLGGPNDKSRVSLIWADGAIKNTWLQVVVKATAATGLADADVFYFGNAVGESGDSATNAVVNSTDEIGARSNPQTFLNPATLANAFDFNRDGFVNATDQILARTNSTTLETSLKLISVPANLAASTMVTQVAASQPAVSADVSGDVGFASLAVGSDEFAASSTLDASATSNAFAPAPRHISSVEPSSTVATMAASARPLPRRVLQARLVDAACQELFTSSEDRIDEDSAGEDNGKL